MMKISFQNIFIFILLLSIFSTVNCEDKEDNLMISQNNLNSTNLQQSSQFRQLREKCQLDSDCDSIQICTPEGHCQRNGILPLSFPEILGSLVIILILGFGQAAGVGGGTSIMPILLALFLYDTKKSVAIVIVLVFSGAVGNVVQLSRDVTHEGVPAIDYRLILITLPSLIVGTVYGVAMNKLLPPLLVCILLVGLLMQQIQKTYIRYKSMKEKEKQILVINQIICPNKTKPLLSSVNHSLKTQTDHHSAVKHPDPITSHSSTIAIPLLDMDQKNDSTSHEISVEQIEKNKQELKCLVEQEYVLYPKKTIMDIAVISVFVVVFSLMRGGSKFHSLIGIPPCGWLYQGMNALLTIILIKWVLMIINKFEETEHKKESLGYTFPNGKLTLEAMKKYAETGLVAGGIGGMLGIGGGIILIPRWLEYGIPSARTTACTLSIICFTTFNSFFQLYLSGSYTIEEIIFFGALALTSSIICRTIKAHVKNTKQDSILVLILVVFMIMASVLLSGIIIFHAIENLEDATSFGKFC